MSRIFFTESERKIIQLLRNMQGVSKAQLARMSGLSWATVVKMTNRLLARGTIVISGPAVHISKPGKKELLYSLSKDRPLSIGIDVEYSSTRLVLMNIEGDVIAESEHPTPQNPTVIILRSFLVNCLRTFFTAMGPKEEHVIGIGIGLPGIVIPAWLKPDIRENRRDLQEFLSSAVKHPVVIEINARSITNYLKWNNPFFPGEDFIFVSIRTGVGMGIIFQGKLFIGHQFISGELGHIKVTSRKVSCRCGGSGCLEPLINQSALYLEYKKKVLMDPSAGQPSSSEIVEGLHDLFSRAAGRDGEAGKIVQRAAALLSRALSYCLMTLFIPNIIISGHFGEDGSIIIPRIARELTKYLLPSMGVNLRYLSLDKVPFAQGDALLALNEYLNSQSPVSRENPPKREKKRVHPEVHPVEVAEADVPVVPGIHV